MVATEDDCAHVPNYTWAEMQALFNEQRKRDVAARKKQLAQAKAACSAKQSDQAGSGSSKKGAIVKAQGKGKGKMKRA